MPPNVDPTDHLLSDVTQRLQALNRSQTSLASMTSSRSMPVARPSGSRGAKYSCDLCLKHCSSSTQMHLHRQTHVMENMAVRLKSSKAASSPEGLKAKESHARQHDLEELSLGPPKGKLESFLNGGRQKIRRGKAHLAPKAQISSFFAGRKTSQRSASSGDSGYESMDRPDPVADLLGMKVKEAKGRGSVNDLFGAQTAAIAKLNAVKNSKVQAEIVTQSAYFDRRRSDEINKFKRFSKQIDQTPLLKHTDAIREDRGASSSAFKPPAAGGRKPAVESRLLPIEPPKPAESNKHLGISMMASAMSSTDDVLGELVSPTSYRSRMESCRQSGASMSDGELSFMGVRAPSLYSVNLRDADNDGVAERLAHNVVKRCLDLQSQRTIRSRTASRQDSNQSTPPTSARHTPATSVSSTSKRSRGKDEVGEDPDDDVRRRDSDSKRSRLEVQQALKLFACPYSKYDPQRFSELNVVEKEYRRCSCCYLRDIPRIKQHLYRVHRRPEYYCGSCFDSFKSRELLDVHVRQRPSCELRAPKYEEKMTDDQLNSIKRRIVKGDPCELWFNIFKTLFPSAPRPLSPYASDNDPTSVNHFVTLFRWFGPEELLNLMRDRREQMDGGLQTLEAPTQAIVDEAFEIALPAYLQSSQPQPEGGRAPLSITEPGDLVRVQSAGSGYIIGPGVPPRSQPAPIVPMTSSFTVLNEAATSINNPYAPLGQHFDGSQMPSLDENAVYAGHSWTDTTFDPAEVTHAFEAYGSAVNNKPLPVSNAAAVAEVVVEDFFDFLSYRS